VRRPFEPSWRGLARAFLDGVWGSFLLCVPGLVFGTVLCFALLSCAGCPAPPPATFDAGPHPTYDGGDVCARVCPHLVDIGCEVPSCLDVCRDAEWKKQTDLHTACLLEAGDKEAARACKSVRCGAAP